MKVLLTPPWSYTACLGFAIMALENLDYKYNDIWPVVAEMRELFDWKTFEDALGHYREGRY